MSGIINPQVLKVHSNKPAGEPVHLKHEPNPLGEKKYIEKMKPNLKKVFKEEAISKAHETNKVAVEEIRRRAVSVNPEKKKPKIRRI